jgi:hypothetical protein
VVGGPLPEGRSEIANGVAAARPAGARSAPARGGSDALADDATLMREASLVAEARGALARGDARGALAAVRAAKRLRTRDLEPEALALEAVALRRLGKEADAAAVEQRLRERYPDHALAR